MNICDDCEIRGYSSELCKMHLKHLAELKKKEKRKGKKKGEGEGEGEGKRKSSLEAKKLYKQSADRKEVKSALYGGGCVLGTTLALTAAPLLGIPAVASAAMVAVKISAATVGGAVGLLKKTKSKES
ncbi:MAG: hypothetical protein HQK53_01410 [Oligoflexia bacterium]|nr:hypothetical protein [Oligoflexia bacterium]